MKKRQEKKNEKNKAEKMSMEELENTSGGVIGAILAVGSMGIDEGINAITGSTSFKDKEAPTGCYGGTIGVHKGEIEPAIGVNVGNGLAVGVGLNSGEVKGLPAVKNRGITGIVDSGDLKK